jgi:hypothetical protein
MFRTGFAWARHRTLSWARLIQSAPFKLVPQRYSLKLCFFLSTSWASNVCSFQIFQPISCRHFSQLLRDQFVSSSFSWSFYDNRFWWRQQIVDLLFMQFSPASHHVLSLRSKYFPSAFSSQPVLFFFFATHIMHQSFLHERPFDTAPCYDIKSPTTCI